MCSNTALMYFICSTDEILLPKESTSNFQVVDFYDSTRTKITTDAHAEIRS